MIVQNLWNSNTQKWGIIVVLSVLWGAFWTFLFYPGLPNSDALYQWQQATDHYYTDVHPIGVTLVMRMIIVFFPGLPGQQQMAILCWLQSSLLWLTLFYSIETFITHRRIKLITSILMPFYYPLWTFSISPIKDVWLAISCLFLVVYFYKVINHEKQVNPQTLKDIFCLKLFPNLIVLAIVIFTMLSRHNIFLSIIFFIVYIYLFSKYLLRINFKYRNIQYIVLFLIISIFCSRFIGNFYYNNHSYTKDSENKLLVNSAFDKKLSSQEKMNFYFSLELIGSIYYTNIDLAKLTFLKSPEILGRENMAKAVENYQCGFNDQYLYLGKNAPLKNMQAQVMQAPIFSDFLNLIARYPIAFIKHKACITSSILQVHQLLFPYQSSIPINSLSEHLKINSENYIPSLKNKVLKFLKVVTHDKRFFLLNLLYRHYILLIISVIVSVYIVRKNQPTSWSNATSLFLLGAGIANFIPYLIVTPDFAWRYLIFSNIIWLLSILAAWNPVNGKQSS